MIYLLSSLLGMIAVGIFYSFSRIFSKKATLFDKLIAYDILSGLLACFLMVLVILLKNPLLLTIVISLMILSFLATLGFARLLAETEDIES